MVRKVLKDPILEAEFQKNGYVIIPFLDSHEVNFLKESFFNTLPESGGHLGPKDENYQTQVSISYDFTFIDKNIDYKKNVFDIISKSFERHVSTWLADYRPIIANFIRKKTNGGEVPLHQNWAFVDEKKCTSVSIWCPLVDSNKENGTLEVVPGSHKRFGEIRGPMIRSELEDIKQDIINKYLVPMNIKAGEAVILDDSIVHYSAINRTENLRLAIQLILVPKEEKSIHYHMDLSKDRSKVELLDVDKEFYMTFNPWKKPDHAARLRSFFYQPFSLSLADFDKQLHGSRFDSDALVEPNEKLSTLSFGFSPVSYQKVSIFRDEKLNQMFLKDGYVIVPFINEEQIKLLLSLYKSSYPEGVSGFFSTTFSNDEKHRTEVDREIREVCSRNLDSLFCNYKSYFSSYIIKAPGEKSELPMHQDMTLVDESKYTGINVWCPLVDLNAENGAIRVLPGSHSLFPTYRGSSLPDIYDNVKQEVHRLMKPCYLKAGEAIIFDQSIIHYSPANLSTIERPVINTFVAHKDARIRICYWDKQTEGKVELFDQDEDFLKKFENFGHDIFSRPKIGKSLGLVPFEFPKLTVELLEKRYGKAPSLIRKSFLQRIFSKTLSHR